MRKLSLITLLAFTFAGCESGNLDDLKQFMDETAKDMQGKVEPLPKVKPYAPFSYDAFDLPDPFKPRKLTASRGGGLQPDLSRPKEPLEAYSIETLKMVGTINKGNRMNAVIATPERGIYHVHPGNYIGQNFGLITKITESEITLKEVVQDSAGDWAERTSTLTLQE